MGSFPVSGPQKAGRWPQVTQQTRPIHCLLWPSSSPVLPPGVSELLIEPRSEWLQHPMAGTTRQGEMANPAAMGRWELSSP